MKHESIEFFRAEYPQWWHPKLQEFPDGWTDLVAEFFQALDRLNSSVSQHKVWVAVHFERAEIGPWTAYIAPIVRMKDWTEGDVLHLIRTVEVFNSGMSRTCEICGSFIGFKSQQPERILCEEHRNVD